MQACSAADTLAGTCLPLPGVGMDVGEDVGEDMPGREARAAAPVTPCWRMHAK
jgi:hypothetical protein